MRIIALLAATLALAACQPPTPDPADTPSTPDARDQAPTPDTPAGPVELHTDATSYAPGGQVGLTIVNRGDAPYAFNPCTRTIEREVAGAWETVPEPDRVCTMEAWILEPGATRTATTELPATLADGRHRLAISLTRDGQQPPAQATVAASPPFTVGR